MSHREPPEDKDTALRFVGWLLVSMSTVMGVWWLLWSVVT